MYSIRRGGVALFFENVATEFVFHQYLVFLRE